MSAPQWIGSPATAGAASGTSLTIAKPTGLANGDLLVVAVRAQGTVATAITTPSGFTRAGGANGAADRAQGIFYKLVADAASEPANYAFSGWSAGRSVGSIRILRGVDPANIIGGSTPYSTTDLAAYASSAAPYLAVAMWGDERTDTRSHVPSATPAGYAGLDNIQSTLDASTTGSRTALWWGSLAIADGGSPEIAAAALTWPVGASANRSVGAAFRGLTTPAAAPAGFSSVAQMLATPGATWAHRGGSANWPEMSEYAYDQAVLAGYGALEFSAHRTSDGVWVGSHDPSLNRTSQTSGLPNISAMTWAQVQTYSNTLNSAGTPRAYYRLDTFLDKYTPTHVCIVDPKNDVSRIAEFLAICDAHGGNTKIVVKFFGVGGGSTALADAAAAKGYQTWGYFYEADVADGDLAADQSHWSLLGMEYGASQASWDAVLSYGKPVVAHIAASQANYDTAIAKGARMVQTSNVLGVRAVGATNLVVETLPALTSASTGATTPPSSTGVAASTLPAATQAATGAVTVPSTAGEATAAFPALTQAATGASEPPAFAGATEASLPPLSSTTSAASVPPTFDGTAAAALPTLAATAAGEVTAPAQAGAVANLLPALSASAAGEVTTPAWAGEIGSTLPALTSTSAAAVGDPGNAAGSTAATLPALSSAAIGTVSGSEVPAPVQIPDQREIYPSPADRAWDAEPPWSDFGFEADWE